MTEIVVSINPPAALEVTFQQQQGISGPPGIQGVPGIAGPMGTTFSFLQSSPSAFWTIQHNLNRYPDVTVTDSTGRVIEGDVRYVDANNLTVGFSGPFSGEAYLN